MKEPLVLASSSPRRAEILHMAGIDFEVMPSTFAEPSHSDQLSDPISFVLEMAIEKGKEVFNRLQEKRTVLAADTIGLLDNRVLEKPTDRNDAFQMLKLMSGKTHLVITAFALFLPLKNIPITGKSETKVTFKSLTEQEINSYLDHASYLDKAAAYAIQGLASVFVERIDGEYFNVVGLPICQINKILQQENV